MENRIDETFRTNDYVATGDRTAVAEPPVPRSESGVNVPIETGNNMPVETGAIGADTGAAALFGSTEAGKMRARWQEIQVGFVDEPRKSVQQADELVQNLAKRLSEIFADQRNRLEHEWDKGESSTEELRNAFRRYRTLFDRLLSV